MRYPFVLLVALLAAAPLLPAPLAAQQNGRAAASDSITRIVPRMDLRDADFHIVSTDGSNAILQRGGVLVVQLTDRGLHRLTRDERERTSEQGGFARLVEAMVRGGLRVLLDNAIEYEISALGEARYDEGTIILLDRNGKRLFDSLSIDGQEFMESFSRRDAERLTRRLNGMIRQQGR